MAATQRDKATPEAEAHFLKARDAESRSDWAMAQAEYVKALESAPTWVEAIVNLGTVYNQAGMTNDAIEAFNRAIKIDPGLFAAQLNLGITYFKGGRYSEAEPPLRKALALQQGNAQAGNLLLLTLFAEEKYAEVAPLAESVLSSAPGSPLALEMAGRAYFKLRDYKNAARTLSQRSRSKPESAELYLMLGQSLDNTGDSDAAIGALEKAIALSAAAPLPDEHFDLGYILWKQRQFERAETEFHRELDRDGSHAPSIYYLGNIALERGDLKNAVALLTKAAQAIPDDFAVHYDLGKALLLSGQAPAAIDALRAAIGLNPKKPDAHYQLGLALRRAGQVEEAAREFQLARRLNDEERADLERKVQGKDKKPL